MTDAAWSSPYKQMQRWSTIAVTVGTDVATEVDILQVETYVISLRGRLLTVICATRCALDLLLLPGELARAHG